MDCIKIMQNCLKEGDIIDLVAPGRGLTEKELAATVEFIKSLGFKPRVPRNLIGKDLFCSNSPEKRFEHLKKALFTDDSKLVWCIRGGYGTAHLIPLLSKISPPGQHKLIAGFSDITALHIFLNQQWGWNTLHCFVPWQKIKELINEQSIIKTIGLLTGKITKQRYTIKPLNNALFGSGIKSNIIGGNMTLVQNSIGTIWQIKPEDKILFLEDVGEKSYRVDRMLTHFSQSGILNKITAVIFGDFTGEGTRVDKKNIDTCLNRFAKTINVPVFRIKGVGHTKTNYPIMFGEEYSICRDGNNHFLVSG